VHVTYEGTNPDTGGTYTSSGSKDISRFQVSVGGIPRVPKSKAAAPSANDKSVTVTLTPSPLECGAFVRAAILEANGDGRATFDDGSTTKTLDRTTTLKIRGTAHSNPAGDLDFVVKPGVSPHQCVSVPFSVRTWPVNFALGNGTDIGGGVLKFTLTWDSETDVLADLAGIEVGELVDYPGNSALYNWTSPPYLPYANDDPVIGWVQATTGTNPDLQSNPGWVSPYEADDFSATQKYRLRDNVLSQVQDFAGQQYTIRRRVYLDTADNKWKYKVEKAGFEANKTLP
jgi:hypothetical protein